MTNMYILLYIAPPVATFDRSGSTTVLSTSINAFTFRNTSKGGRSHVFAASQRRERVVGAWVFR